MLMRPLLTFCFLIALICSSLSISYSEPVRRITGVITEVGDGFIRLIAKNELEPQKYLLPWKTRFIPPKLPLKGDHVTILYKMKEEGLVIYALEYSRTSPESKDSALDSGAGKNSK